MKGVFGGNLIRVLGPYFEGGSCQTPWGMIPRNLTLPLSEHPLSRVVVLILCLSGVCNAFYFSARHVVALFCAGSSHEDGGQEESRRQVDIGNNQVEDNREVHDRKEEIIYSKE